MTHPPRASVGSWPIGWEAGCITFSCFLYGSVSHWNSFSVSSDPIRLISPARGLYFQTFNRTCALCLQTLKQRRQPAKFFVLSSLQEWWRCISAFLFNSLVRNYTGPLRSHCLDGRGSFASKYFLSAVQVVNHSQMRFQLLVESLQIYNCAVTHTPSSLPIPIIFFQLTYFKPNKNSFLIIKSQWFSVLSTSRNLNLSWVSLIHFTFSIYLA